MMLLHIRHHTHYRYENPQRRFIESLRLTPSVCDNQKTLAWSVSVEGAKMGACFTDGAGDRISTLTLQGHFTELELVVEGSVETTDMQGVLTGHAEVMSPLVYLRDTRLTQANAPLRELARELAQGQQAGSLDLAHRLCESIRDRIRYAPGSTHHDITAAEALANGTGVCQDHAHALIAVARANGYPARYVVGYLHSDADGNSHEASHAWAELHVESLGWVGFDATNGICPDERYLRLGSGLDAHDAAPVRGIAIGPVGKETLDVTVSVLSGQQ